MGYLPLIYLLGQEAPPLGLNPSAVRRIQSTVREDAKGFCMNRVPEEEEASPVRENQPMVKRIPVTVRKDAKGFG